MQHPSLIFEIRKEVNNFLKGYIQSPLVLNQIDEYIVPPALGNLSGALGAISLAIDLIK